MQQITIDGCAGWGKTPDFWDENADLKNVVLSLGNAGAEIPDFATFPGETLSAEKAETDAEPKKKRRPVRYDVVTNGSQYSDTIVTYLATYYDDGSERWRVLAVQNPAAVYVRKYRDDLYKVISYPEIPEVELLCRIRETAEVKEKPEARYYALENLSEDELAYIRWGWRKEPPPGWDDGADALGLEKDSSALDDSGRFVPNLIRARTYIEQYGLCNDWQYFVTLTLSGNSLSRDDLETFRKKLNQMVRNLRRNYDCDIDFLLVPELHPEALKDGRTEWHMHGLMNLPEQFLIPFTDKAIYGENKNKRPPRYIQDLIHKGIPVWHWKQADSAFGYNTVEKVQSRDASTRYLLKYLSKTQAAVAAHIRKGQHLYFVSRGLKKAEKMPPECLQAIRGGHVELYQKFGADCLVQWYKLLS